MANKASEIAQKYFDSINFSYTVTGEEQEALRAAFELKNRTDLDLMMIFDPAANSCAIRSFGIAKIQDGTEDKIYALMNRLNAQFRWVKFTLIESSKTIVAADDLLLEEKTIGEETFSHAMQMARIIDEAYPEMMQTIWGGK
ncbi:MAG: YbjN domain-containing protein [Neisseriaceae bacterium]|nr:YbjN domain-containing protein [Neisseriaceae bacterium]MBQ5429751.1 YbjN domain-containing protein [Neisseriaceae bacterium]